MKFRLVFDIDNAAFREDRNDEICRVLQRVAYAIEAGYEPTHTSIGAPYIVKDSNGNGIGCYQLVGKK